MAEKSSKKVSIILTYASSGSQPPIFLAGSFSEPAWHPQEMEFIKAENGEIHFHKEVEVDEDMEYQYKFRIGLGDWWVLSGDHPIVTDEVGNRNNLLVVHTAEELEQESEASETSETSETFEASEASDRGILDQVSDLPIPNVLGKAHEEPGHEEPGHEENLFPQVTVDQNDAHDILGVVAEPDDAINWSQATTPMYANTAAEVANTAAILDREPSPAPISDEEAGRTGERRMSQTPIPEVALTAAEVADTAAILDQDGEDSHGDRINLPHVHLPYDNPSGPVTPWYENAPLFSHELAGSHEEELESPVTSETVESPSKPDPEDEAIDLNDPTLERFPVDRLSILTHIRSCESRMGEDETNVQGILPSPITKANSRSPSIDTPGSARLDAQPSPILGVITEENCEEDSYFDDLPGPVQKLQAAQKSRIPDELSIVQEVEKPNENLRSVLDKLDNIGESTADSGNTIVEEGIVETKMDKNLSVEATGFAKESNAMKDTNELSKDDTEMIGSLNPEATSETENPQPGPTGIEVQPKSKDKGVREDRHPDLEDKKRPEKSSDASAHVVDTLFQVKGHEEQNEDNVNHKGGQPYSNDWPIPEIHQKPVEDFNKHEVVHRAVHDAQTDVEGATRVQHRGELMQDEQRDDQQEMVARVHNLMIERLDSRPFHLEGESGENEKPDDALNASVQADRNVVEDAGLEDQDEHLVSVDAVHVVDSSEEMTDPTKLSESQELKQLELGEFDGLSKEAMLMKDSTAKSMSDAQDVTQATILDSTPEHGHLERDTHRSAVSLEEPNERSDTTRGVDLPILNANADDVSIDPEQDVLGSRGTDKNPSREVEKSAIHEISRHVVGETNITDSPLLKGKSDEVPPTQEHKLLGSEVPKSAVLVDQPSNEAEPIHKADISSSGTKLDEEVSQKPTQQLLASEVDKSTPGEDDQQEFKTISEADLPVSILSLDDTTLSVHGKQGTSDANYSDKVDSALTNGFDDAKSTSVDALSLNGNETDTKLNAPTFATPKSDHPTTPSSINSPIEAPESKKTIWRIVFVEWLGGIIANLCGGDRGPILVFSAVIILGPLLALYFYQLDKL